MGQFQNLILIQLILGFFCLCNCHILKDGGKYAIQSIFSQNSYLSAYDEGCGNEYTGSATTEVWKKDNQQIWIFNQTAEEYFDMRCFQMINYGNAYNNLVISIQGGVRGFLSFVYWSLIHVGKGNYIIRSCQNKDYCLFNPGHGRRVRRRICQSDFALNGDKSQLWKLLKLKET